MAKREKLLRAPHGFRMPLRAHTRSLYRGARSKFATHAHTQFLFFLFNEFSRHCQTMRYGVGAWPDTFCPLPARTDATPT
jgi:hypothetical protein